MRDWEMLTTLTAGVFGVVVSCVILLMSHGDMLLPVAPLALGSGGCLWLGLKWLFEKPSQE